MKRIILCADDYGQNPAVSQAIVELFEKKRLSATSCLVTSLDWSSHWQALKPFKGQVDMGLHFNLSEGRPLSDVYINKYGTHFPVLPQLMLRTYLQRLDKQVIFAELQAQLDRFMNDLGQPPDYIDGHQHIHQLPLVRDVLIHTLISKGLDATYVRCTDRPYAYSSREFNLKSLVIQLSGAKRLKTELIKHHIPHNDSFAGIYRFSESAKYPVIFSNFLKKVGDRGLIMCHPGLKPVDTTDVIGEARYHEYQYLNSEQFISDCQADDVMLTRGLF